MKMSNIIGCVISVAIVATAITVYPFSRHAEAANSPQEVIYVDRVVDRVVERIVEVPEIDPEAIFADVSEEDRYCLEQNVYFESRGESQVGQEFVAWVTLNRVMHPDFPNEICKVVWQDQQFSWTHDGKGDTPKDKAAWATAQSIVGEVLLAYGVDRDPTEGATYFHAAYVTPDWTKKFERVVRIDSHIFYVDNRG